MHPVFTIGHSNHAFAAFRALLTRHDVGLVADVRSVPFSRRLPHFARDALADTLGAAGIGYLWLGDGLGGRAAAFAGIADPAVRYGRIAESDAFRAGLDRVLAAGGMHRVALMCAEREPMQCHRALLVSPHLAARGADIRHIHADGHIEPHGDFEDRMIAAVGTAPPPLFADHAGRAAALRDAYARAARGFRSG